MQWITSRRARLAMARRMLGPAQETLNQDYVAALTWLSVSEQSNYFFGYTNDLFQDHMPSNFDILIIFIWLLGAQASTPRNYQATIPSYRPSSGGGYAIYLF